MKHSKCAMFTDPFHNYEVDFKAYAKLLSLLHLRSLKCRLLVHSSTAKFNLFPYPAETAFTNLFISLFMFM